MAANENKEAIDDQFVDFLQMFEKNLEKIKIHERKFGYF